MIMRLVGAVALFLDLLGCGLCRWPNRSADEPLSSLDRHLCRPGLRRGRADGHSHKRPGGHGDYASNASQNAQGIQPIKPVRMALLGWCLSAARVAGVCLTEASPPAPTSTNRPPRAPFTGGLGNRIVLGNGPDTVVAGAGNDVVSLGRGDDEVTQRAIAGRVGLQMTGRALISLKVNDASAMSASFDPCSATIE